MIINQAFNGAGDTFTPTVLSFIFMWLIQIPLAYTLAVVLQLGSKGVYISIALSSVLITIAAIYLFRKGKWKKTVV
jgi:Na+-driven multidrug efflux pump